MLTLGLDQGSRPNQGKARLGRGMAMDWSGDGRWTGTHAARQAEPGHGTAVAMAARARAQQGSAGLVQGAARSGGREQPGEALLGLTASG